MTLAFALRGSNGLVLGADSRLTGPGISSDTSIKFLQVNREIGIMTYGLAEVGYDSINSIVETVNRIRPADPGPRIVNFSEIAETARRICVEKFAEAADGIRGSGGNPDDPRYTTGFILAGLDINESSQFRVVSLQSPGFKPVQEHDMLAAQWRVSQLLLGRFYYPQMDVEQLKRLAIFLLIETETVSDSVGGRLKIATVTLDNGFQFLSEGDVQDLVHEGQPRFAGYRRALLENLRH